MTFSQHLTPASKAELLSSSSTLALSSADVQRYTADVSRLVENILGNPNVANDNKAPTASLENAA